MKRFGLVVLMLALFAPAAWAQKVEVEYDREFDFTGLETYQWVEPPQNDDDPLVRQRIFSAIDYHLANLGAHKSEDDPDFYVTFAASSQDQVKVSSPNLGYSYGPGWGGFYGSQDREDTGSTSYSWREGSLVILAWEAENNQVIWQGSATGVVPKKPEKLVSKIDDAVAKIFRKWQKLAAAD